MPGMTFEDGLRLWELIYKFAAVFAWPVLIIALVLIFRDKVAHLVENVKNLHFPGGSVEFRDEAVQLSIDAKAPDPEKKERPAVAQPIATDDLNAAQVARGLQPTPSRLDLNYFRELVTRDPNLALAALRVEVEIVIQNLAKGFGVAIDSSGSASQSLRSLHQAGAITNNQLGTARKILDLTNRAIHGEKVDATTALAVIDATGPLLSDYKAWLSWGFPGK
jgi:hypothetical protein